MLVTAAREDEDETTRRGAVLALAKMEPLAGVAALLEVVKTGKDSQTRTAAYDQIRYLGQAAVPALLEALDDPVPVHRSTVAELLDRRWTPGNDANAAAYWLAKGDLKRAVELGPVAIEPMIAILRSNSATRWFEYVSALASFPVQAEGPLIAALSEPGFLGRELVCMALGKIAHRRSVPPLIATLNDDNWHVRRAAIGALGAIGDQSAVPVLIDLLQDDSSTIRASAAGELASFLNPQAVEPLCRSLQDSSPAVRAAAARTLGRHGDTRAVEPLCTLLAQVAAGDEEESARVDVAEALGRLGDRQALPVLQTAAQTDPSGRVRRQAETAIDLLKKSKRRK